MGWLPTNLHRLVISGLQFDALARDTIGKDWLLPLLETLYAPELKSVLLEIVLNNAPLPDPAKRLNWERLDRALEYVDRALQYDHVERALEKDYVDRSLEQEGTPQLTLFAVSFLKRGCDKNPVTSFQELESWVRGMDLEAKLPLLAKRGILRIGWRITPCMHIPIHTVTA